jgi:hypothetical protein
MIVVADLQLLKNQGNLHWIKGTAEPLRRCGNGSDERACSIVGSSSSCVQASLCQRTNDLAAKSAGVVWHLDARRAVSIDDCAE